LVDISSADTPVKTFIAFSKLANR